MLDSLILATAFLASQGGYTMPSAAPAPRAERRETQKPAAPAATPQPAVAAVPGKTLSDLPNVTTRYFDVSGKNLKAINKVIEQGQKPDSSGRAPLAPTSYAVDATFNKLTHDGQCKVTGAKATFSATVVLPRLTPSASHTPELLATWRAYIAGVENSHAADLWFVYDRLRTVESAILASSCENAQSAGAAAVERLKAEATAFQRSKIPAAPAPQATKYRDLED